MSERIEKLKARHRDELERALKEEVVIELIGELPEGSLAHCHKHYFSVRIGNDNRPTDDLKQAAERLVALYQQHGEMVATCRRTGLSKSVKPPELHERGSGEDGEKVGVYLEVLRVAAVGTTASLNAWVRIGGSICEIEIPVLLGSLPQSLIPQERFEAGNSGGRRSTGEFLWYGLGEDSSIRWAAQKGGYRGWYCWESLDSFLAWLRARAVSSEGDRP